MQALPESVLPHLCHRKDPTSTQAVCSLGSSKFQTCLGLIQSVSVVYRTCLWLQASAACYWTSRIQLLTLLMTVVGLQRGWLLALSVVLSQRDLGCLLCLKLRWMCFECWRRHCERLKSDVSFVCNKMVIDKSALVVPMRSSKACVAASTRLILFPSTAR